MQDVAVCLEAGIRDLVLGNVQNQFKPLVVGEFAQCGIALT